MKCSELRGGGENDLQDQNVLTQKRFYASMCRADSRGRGGRVLIHLTLSPPPPENIHFSILIFKCTHLC